MYEYARNIDYSVSDQRDKMLLEKVNNFNDQVTQLHESISKKILNVFGYPVDCVKVTFVNDNKVQYVVNGVVVAEVQKNTRLDDQSAVLSYFIMSDEDIIKLSKRRL